MIGYTPCLGGGLLVFSIILVYFSAVIYMECDFLDINAAPLCYDFKPFALVYENFSKNMVFSKLYMHSKLRPYVFYLSICIDLSTTLVMSYLYRNEN